MGRHEEALALDEKTLETRSRVSGEDHAETQKVVRRLESLRQKQENAGAEG
ncbi:tetratricopeptide repeat protein [Streptomyces sp. NBC_00124]|uniref:tetratricopeptide repeat protein n=1 Tax=Streptomyces sp. NBC_00124 TaxID=2975662 RepID=UPI00338F5650